VALKSGSVKTKRRATARKYFLPQWKVGRRAREGDHFSVGRIRQQKQSSIRKTKYRARTGMRAHTHAHTHTSYSGTIIHWKITAIEKDKTYNACAATDRVEDLVTESTLKEDEVVVERGGSSEEGVFV
jgi:hypothetical protein